jgi:hypothetical protein
MKEMESLRRNSDASYEVEGSEEGSPTFVKPVPRYEADVMAYKALTNPQLPPKCHARSNVVITVAYGFADASGK